MKHKKTIVSFVVGFLLICAAFVTSLFYVVGQTCNGSVKRTRIQIQSFQNNLEAYHMDCGRYPTSEESWSALAKEPVSCKGWAGPYREFHGAILGCKESDYMNLKDANHQFSYSGATLSLATIFLKNCLSLQRIISKDRFQPPQDSWAHDFNYTSDGISYEIKSLGKDGLPGGDGINRDISSRDLDD